MKLLYISIFCFVFIDGIAQLQNIQGAGNEVLKKNKYDDIEGSVYLYEDWRSGSMVDSKGNIFPNLFLKYDAYKGNLELNKSGVTIVVDKLNHPSFTISYIDEIDKTIKTETFKNGISNLPNVDVGEYFQVLIDGKIELIKRIKTSILEENSTTYGGQTKTKRFVKKVTYFFRPDGNSKFIELGISKKSIISSIPGYETIIKTDLSKRKMKTEADLVFILNYCSENLK